MVLVFIFCLRSFLVGNTVVVVVIVVVDCVDFVVDDDLVQWGS